MAPDGRFADSGLSLDYEGGNAFPRDAEESLDRLKFGLAPNDFIRDVAFAPDCSIIRRNGEGRTGMSVGHTSLL